MKENQLLSLYVIFNELVEEEIPGIFTDKKEADKMCELLNKCGHVGKYCVLEKKLYNSMSQFANNNKEKYLQYLNSAYKEEKAKNTKNDEEVL